jgi:hypothetical protein
VKLLAESMELPVPSEHHAGRSRRRAPIGVTRSVPRIPACSRERMSSRRRLLSCWLWWICSWDLPHDNETILSKSNPLDFGMGDTLVSLPFVKGCSNCFSVTSGQQRSERPLDQRSQSRSTGLASPASFSRSDLAVDGALSAAIRTDVATTVAAEGFATVGKIICRTARFNRDHTPNNISVKDPCPPVTAGRRYDV